MASLVSIQKNIISDKSVQYWAANSNALLFIKITYISLVFNSQGMLSLEDNLSCTNLLRETIILKYILYS